MKAALCPVSRLTKEDVAEAFTLFSDAFEASFEGFSADLGEKDHILRLYQDETLMAFSTLRSYFPAKDVEVVFSGDTYVKESMRLGHRMPSLWARHIFGRIKTESEHNQVYWLLLCSGFRTYKILPTFFKRFSPRKDSDSELSNLAQTWSEAIFGDRCCDGVVKPKWATPLRQPEPPHHLKNDPNVRFFLEQNPGYAHGDELICLAPLSVGNLRPAGLRLVR